MGNATSAGLGSEASHDERDIRSAGGQYSDNRPIDIELAEEAKGSEVINRKSNLDSEVPRPPGSYKQRWQSNRTRTHILGRTEPN